MRNSVGNGTADLLHNLRHPLVRDLAWCVFSSPLVHSPPYCDSEQIEPDQSDVDYFLDLERAPDDLLDWMSYQMPRRLGLRFERFWQFWLTQRHPESAIEHRFNLQIQNGDRTLGELDCVSLNTDRHQLIHRELAVKFYLGIHSDRLPENFRPPTSRCWVGANVSDRLDLKCKQMFQRQMRWLERPEARKSLPPDWTFDHLQKRAITRGRLFYPSEWPPDAADGFPVHSQHQRGQWLTVKALESTPGDAWLILAREHWFAERVLEDSRQILGLDNLVARVRQQLQHTFQPLQVIRLDWSDGLWREQQRIFVVPDQWPATATPLRRT